MIAPFEPGMDILTISGKATNNAIATPQIRERLLYGGVRKEGGWL
jgi:hypothetical protein